jgi:hypothetical protein
MAGGDLSEPTMVSEHIYWILNEAFIICTERKNIERIYGKPLRN